MTCSRRVRPLAMACVACIAAALVVRWGYCMAVSPAVMFLMDGRPAAWIQPDVPYSCVAKSGRNMRTGAMFRREFTLDQDIPSLRLSVGALRRAGVWLDADFRTQAPLAMSQPDFSGWRRCIDVSIEEPLARGRHTLDVFVENDGGPPCLAVAGAEAELRTDERWKVLRNDGSYGPVRRTSTKVDLPAADCFPAAAEGLAACVPTLILLFAGGWAAGLALDRWQIPKEARPKVVRWCLLAAYAVVCLRNLPAIMWQAGFDLDGHVDYVRFISTHCRLPLATDGWTMFQPPLFYLLAAPFDLVFTRLTSPETAVKLLRFLPMLCGAGLIEIAFRSGRAVFPNEPEKQAVAVVVGGFLPINVYQCQLVHNEPLAGLLTAAAMLGAILLVTEPQRPRTPRFFALIGAAWGLAVLAKPTPLLLMPSLVGAVAWRAVQRKDTGLQAAKDAASLCGAAALVAGGFFLRNLVSLGRPMVTGWDRGRGHDWWQDPGFRSPAQLLHFDQGISRPIYAAVHGYLDGLYSTLWTDGMLSGFVPAPELLRIWWNIDWLVALAPLGLVPSLLIAVGGWLVLRATVDPRTNVNPGLVLAISAVASLLVAHFDLWLRLPVYSTCKATYLLGVAPAIGLIAAAGAGPFMTTTIGRRTLGAFFTAWCGAVAIAFFCISRT